MYVFSRKDPVTKSNQSFSDLNERDSMTNSKWYKTAALVLFSSVLTTTYCLAQTAAGSDVSSANVQNEVQQLRKLVQDLQSRVAQLEGRGSAAASPVAPGSTTAPTTSNVAGTKTTSTAEPNTLVETASVRTTE